jgi:hypothetical protein
MAFVIEDLKQEVPNTQFIIDHQNIRHVLSCLVGLNQ